MSTETSPNFTVLKAVSFYKSTIEANKIPCIVHRNKAEEKLEIMEKKPRPAAKRKAEKDTSDESIRPARQKLPRAAKEKGTEKVGKIIKEEKENSIEVKVEKIGRDGRMDEEVKIPANGMSTYEAMRMKNIEENAKFFASLGIFQAKDDLSASTSKKTKTVVRGLKAEKAKPEPLPRRAPSLRLQGKTPDGSEIPGFQGYQTSFYVTEPLEDRQRERHPEGPLQMDCTNVKKETKEEGDDFIKGIAKETKAVKQEKPEKLGAETNSLLRRLQNLKISERCVAKVVPNRVFSVGFHPSDTRTIVAAGDKWGMLGFWDMDSSEGDDGVFLFNPHVRPINCLQFCPSQPSKIYTCSYDGTVRCGDFEKGVFDEIYATDEEDDAWIHSFDFLDSSGTKLLLAQNQRGGYVTIEDTRSSGKIGEKLYRLHEKNIRTVSVHPMKRQYFVTASTDSTMALWDIRKLNSSGSSKSICCLTHGKGLNSAYFSPLTGTKILSTCADDRLRICHLEESGDIVKGATVAISKSHNNHTGRWLTKFRATWHPRCEEIFVVGSMARPRRIELFSDKMQLLHEYISDEWLGSVCSLNEFHPTRDIIAGANSSGRLHVFK
ncbi:WD repeat-containing protein 76 [Holothuria leucospilota]|uniref:WD repeat-containing protein 76 n=1 Tax=Holothuria leucospilota TaxID=206669 RepID=A0A9Q1HKQ4_HOLLE|nr:WD repeat-containing protein 76 [Holothuria leucospilota]